MAFVEAVVEKRPDLVTGALAFRAINGPEVHIHQETLPDLAGFQEVQRILGLSTETTQQILRIIFNGDENALREVQRNQGEPDVA